MPELESKKGLFKREAPPKDIRLNEDVSDLSRRLRISEERYTTIRNRIQVMDQNMLLHNKKQTADIKTIDSDINDLKKEINDLNEKINLIIKELNDSAKKEDIEVLQKYINLWDPMNFVTRKEVEKLIKELKNELTK